VMKQVFLSYHDIHTDCIELAKIIKKKFKPEKLILISRGGLIPGSIIANYLGIQDIDVIAMKTYSNRKRTNKIEIFKRIKSQKKLVVIDDLVDSGETAKIVKSMMPNSKFVTLYAKTSGKKTRLAYNKKCNKEAPAIIKTAGFKSLIFPLIALATT
jgi:xanthine phosphoribosyltransferase